MITKKNYGVGTLTLAVKLVFSTETLPEHVAFGYCRYTVKPNTPLVLQCTNAVNLNIMLVNVVQNRYVPGVVRTI